MLPTSILQEVDNNRGDIPVANTFEELLKATLK
jgi:hypothetical protein